MFVNEEVRDKVWEACELKGDHIGCETEEYDVVSPRFWAVVDDYNGDVHLFTNEDAAKRDKEYLDTIHGIPGIEAEFTRIMEAKVR